MPRRLAPLALRAALALAASGIWPCRADEALSQHLRDLIEDYLAPTLVLPETAEWSYDPVKPFVGGQTLVCGWVNYQSSVRKYVGMHRFYAILQGNTVNDAEIYDPAEDNAGNIAKKFVTICGRV